MRQHDADVTFPRLPQEAEHVAAREEAQQLCAPACRAGQGRGSNRVSIACEVASLGGCSFGVAVMRSTGTS